MNVPGNRIYISRKDEGEGVFDARELGQADFSDRSGTAIAERLAKAARIKSTPEQRLASASRVSMPQQRRQQRQRPRRMYVPVDEYGASTRFAIVDRTTGVVMARCYGSPFYVSSEAVKLCRSQGVSDREFVLKPL